MSLSAGVIALALVASDSKASTEGPQCMRPLMNHSAMCADSRAVKDIVFMSSVPTEGRAQSICPLNKGRTH